MSALLPKADICSALAHVRCGPKADVLRCEKYVPLHLVYFVRFLKTNTRIADERLLLFRS
jgi:hypothetical protein